MAESEDIQPLVCDNGTGMVKVPIQIQIFNSLFFYLSMTLLETIYSIMIVDETS